MKRYGPLIAVDGALAVGDAGRRHLRLTPDAVIVRDGAVATEIIAWDRVRRITLDVPTTRFRLPGLVSTLVLSVLTVFALGDLGVDPDDGAATIVVDGHRRQVPLSRHHVGGYWSRSIDGAHRLLGRLIERPQERALLARPDALVAVAAKLARAT